MEITKTAKKVGNSAGVLLPKKFLGSEFKLILIKRPFNLKKATIKLLMPFLSEIQGVYILNKSPLELIAVSATLKKTLKTDKFKLSIVPFSLIKKDIKHNNLLCKKLSNAETILNKSLEIELKKLIPKQNK